MSRPCIICVAITGSLPTKQNGPAQVMINEWHITKGGHTCTGLEDNVRLDRDTLARSDAALVRRAVVICKKHHRSVALGREARNIFDLAQPAL